MSSTITRIEKSTPDKRLRLDIPVDAAGRDYVVEIKEAPEAPVPAKGWPPGFLERTYGSITDPTFARPPQDLAKEPPRID